MSAPPRVRALSTTRQGGVSVAPFDSFNLGHHVGELTSVLVYRGWRSRDGHFYGLSDAGITVVGRVGLIACQVELHLC